MSDDARYVAMRQRFKTLTMAQLCEMRDNIDKTLFDTHNYHDGKFCPMGIALGCHLMQSPTDEAVKARIAENYQPTNILKGVPGTFYHGDDASRRRDLLRLIDELLTELCGVETPSRLNTLIAQTVVWHEGTRKWFFVSTLERNSSAAACPESRYNETLVWEGPNRDGRIIFQGDAAKGSIQLHQRVVESLHLSGEVSHEGTMRPADEMLNIIRSARFRGLGPHDGCVTSLVRLPMTEPEYRRFLELSGDSGSEHRTPATKPVEPS